MNPLDTINITKELLSKLKKERDREVLSKRFSLDGSPKNTLEEIGQVHKITRERVRQIEKAAMARLKKETTLLSDFHNRALAIVKRGGGISTENELKKELLVGDPSESAIKSLVFLLSLHDGLEPLGEEAELSESWRLSSLSEESIISILSKVISVLKEINTPLSFDELLGHIDTNAELLRSLLDASENIVRIEDGKYGLSSWRDINPKSIRDKTYYVLKKFGKPMHFANIAENIRKLNFDDRSVTKQAVHNELIRDNRFVLIGRGIYALSEWGYKPGIVAEVIADILSKANGPMHKNDIVAEVLKHRVVKEATIVLNLQDKTRFKRVAKATYALLKDTETTVSPVQGTQ